MDGQSLLAALKKAAVLPFTPSFDAGERLYWPYLLGSAVLALGIYLWRNRQDSSAWRPNRALAYLAPKRIWLHRSTWLDIKLTAAKAALEAAIALPAALSAFAIAFAIVSFLDRSFGQPPQLAWPAWVVTAIYTLVLFIAWDYSRYWLHRLFHRVPALWQFHQVHHSAEVLTPLTLYRTHPVESALMAVRGMLLTGLITGFFFYLFRERAVQWSVYGVNALGFLFNMLGGNLRHSHVWLGYGPRLERWLISPAQHQIHHSMEPRHVDKNYGAWLAVWDRWSGSLATSVGENPAAFGLPASERNHHPHRLWSSLWRPVVASLQVLRRGKSSRQVVAALLALLLLATQLNAEPAASAAATEAAPDFETPLAEAVLDEGAAPPAVNEVEDGGDLLPVLKILGRAERRAYIAGSAHTVDQQELEQMSYDDVHQILAQVPGVYVRGEDGFGLRPNIGLRGASSDRSAKVTLLEDGVLLAPAPYAAPAAYFFPMVARMTEIEVFKGPAAIRHGPNTIGGAINMLTRSNPVTNEGQLDVAYGSFRGERLHAWWGHGGEHWGVLLEGMRWTSNGFKNLDYGPVDGADRPSGDNTGFDKNEFMLKLRLNSDSSGNAYHQVELKLGVADERSNETYLGLSDADFAARPYRRYAASQLDRMDWLRTLAELRYVVAIGSDIDLSLTLYRHDLHREWSKLDAFRGGSIASVLDNPDSGQNAVYYGILAGQQDSATVDEQLLIGTNERTYIAEGAQAAARWRTVWGRSKHAFEFGARLHHDQIVRDHRQHAFLMQAGAMVSDGKGRTQTADTNGQARAGAFHFYDEIRIGDFMLAPGTRVEVIRTTFSDRLAGAPQQIDLRAIWLPGGGISYSPVEWLTLLAGAHKGFSPVAPGQPAEVEPETSLNYEVGLRLALNQTSAELIGFASDYDNLVTQCTQSSGCSDALLLRQFNAGQVLVAGLEAGLSQRVDLKAGWWLSGNGNYTLTRSRFGGSFVSADPHYGSVSEGDALPYVPVHQAVLKASVGQTAWDSGLAVRYNGAMRDRPGQGAIAAADRIDGYTVFDWSANYRPLPRLAVYATIDNLFDNAYMASRRPFGARPGAPLTVLAGLKVNL